MAAFFSNQLDFIYFFYGLAFILLGLVCLAIARGNDRQTPWWLMAAFGFTHGATEWLDLTAIFTCDSPVFAAARVALMTASFAALVEFARIEAGLLGHRVPGRWIHVALLLFALSGAYLGGILGVNAFARYSFALLGSLGVAAVALEHAKHATAPRRRWIVGVSVGFSLYGLAAGAVIPESVFLPAELIDNDVFAGLTGAPIQLVRGLIACGIALAVWGMWSHRKAADVDSARYTVFVRRQFLRTMMAMAAILACGWLLTDFLGEQYRRNVEEAARGDLDVIASRVDSESSAVARAVQALAGAQSVRDLLAGGGGDTAHAAAALERHVHLSGANDAVLLDRRGRLQIASSGGVAHPDIYSQSQSFLTALAGQPGFQYAIDWQSGRRSYQASFPVRGDAGAILGVAVMSKSLEPLAAQLQHFERPYFVVDVDGVVVMTNRPEQLYQPLWLQPPAAAALSQQRGTPNRHPLFGEEISAPAWVLVDGLRDYVQRRALAHGDWSLVTLRSPRGVLANRVFGIFATLQMAILAIAYLVGWERRVHDDVQLERRTRLEALTRHLDIRATTDPLTGLYNRRRFDRDLAAEMLRAKRYGTPLSLVMFDIDHFKQINDRYGHQAGDSVLVELAHLVAAHVRAHDIVARWGGEEFIILAPGSDGPEALQLAEKLHDRVNGFSFEQVGTVSCSFGVAELADREGPESLLARVDAALYRAKVGGRDRVEFSPLPHAPSELAAAG